MKQLESCGRTVRVFGAEQAETVIWMHTFSDEAQAAFALLPPEMQARTAIAAVAMPDPDWNAMLSPWAAPALFKKEPPFAGNADTAKKPIAKRRWSIIPTATRATRLPKNILELAPWPL